MYQSAENTYGEERIQARQIYCIYLLNYSIGLPDSPIVKVGKKITDLGTGKELDCNNEFIRSLTHDIWAVQVKYLKGRRSSELEKLLSIFDQSNITENWHILNVDERQFTEEYRHIIRKLQEACVSKELQHQMRAEDNYQTEIEIAQKTIEESKKTIEESKKTIEENKISLAEKDKEIAELKKLLENKEITK
jgi:septal ring factor EnvC (AmiA/AmiB activator)